MRSGGAVDKLNYDDIRNIFKNSPAERVGPPIKQELWKRSIESSLDFIEQNIAKAVCFETRSELHAYALTKLPPTGLICEFGVYKGHSVNALADALAHMGDPRPIFGFDSFEGLSEDWFGHFALAGTFDLGGNLPEVREKVQLISGWVDDSLPKFLENNVENIALAHIDTDTYSPCRDILNALRGRFVPGSIIIFDELLAFPGWQNHEYRALQECVDVPYDFIAFSGHHAAIQFT